MNLSEQDIAIVVEKIKEEVKRAIDPAPEAKTDTVQGTVVLVCAYVPNSQKALSYLTHNFGEGLDVFTLNGVSLNCNACHVKALKTDADKNMGMDRLALAKNIVLVTPPIGMLKNIANGNDTGFVENAVLKSILWGRKVHILLDFKPPKFRRGTFFESIVNAIDALTSMDVKVAMYKVAKDGNANKVALVTEAEIIDAHHSGEKTVFADANAIITPLAKDTAKELRVNIQQV